MLSASFKERLKRVFAEKEVYFRSHGSVRFLRVSSAVQIVLASIVTALLVGWMVGTLLMVYSQAGIAHDRALIDAKAKSVAAEATRVNAYKRSVNDIASDLDRRQDMLDDMVRSQFGPTGTSPDVVGAPDGKTEGDVGSANDKLSQQSNPAIEKLNAINARQTRFARNLATLINARAAKAEAAIRSFGLRPEQIARRSGASAQGGPYIPAGNGTDMDVPAFAELAKALAHLNALERGLVSIPSGRPTTAPMESSSYGYRRDPFNGHTAFHSGIDFRGRYGQPILAAAAGRVSFVGNRQGYGKVVEIDHGNGIMTRYAHLSSFGAKQGQTVTRGIPIARMGSTGRSTGTHLHFEVRVNGAAINPRRFLEVKEDVLKVQQIAKQRFARVSSKAGTTGEHL